MATIVSSIGLRGIEGYEVQVEVQLIPGMEGIRIIGLPDASVKESKDRLIGALFANHFDIPDKKIIVNLSPIEEKKNSPFFDLAMAIGIMKESGEIKDPIPADAAFLGVLSLDGTVKSVAGMLPAIIAARKEGFKRLYLPANHNLPIHYIEGIEFHLVQTLQDVIASFSDHLTTLYVSSTNNKKTLEEINFTYDKDFQHVIGHEQAKRALEIAAAGAHNLLMTGPPGCGKSLLAEVYPSILPPLKQETRLEVMSIYQLTGNMNHSSILPPFREPHHSASAVSLVGGGSNPKPGEVTLAHGGVLFLDEMAEFPKRTLDMLRQPLESGKLTISRAASTVTYPARFQLLGAMNPCPCGHLGSRNFYCTCSRKQINAYQNRVSGPIEDRMDILLKLHTVSLENETVEHNEASKTIRERVIKAREMQHARYKGEFTNASAPTEQLMLYANLDTEQKEMIHQWTRNQNWSTRVQVKILRLARTISDLNEHNDITSEALWEAVNLRRLMSVLNRSDVAK